jgi:hypothetical protein
MGQFWPGLRADVGARRSADLNRPQAPPKVHDDRMPAEKTAVVLHNR